ncbi:MAG: pantoate--beta-alanine ligase [Leptospiraceae bacterium]|nr:pantoate--beta-alanine ligase [Leptospiraceae bacterium]
MKSYQTIDDIRAAVHSAKQAGKTVGLVPTMGFLHEGHLELIRQSKQDCDATVVSIFVNPTQFNDASDYQNYPVDIKRDLDLLANENVDLVFLPNPQEMYPEDLPELKMSMPSLTANLCGKFRPGHFDGVLLVVSKLFQIVSPSNAYFGLKDYQQYLVIHAMARALNFPVKVLGCETIREEDGLAMSSRNARLSQKARGHAALIPRALNLVQKTLQDRRGRPSVDCAELCEIAWDVVESGTLNRVEYMDIVDPNTLEILETLVPDQEARIATAVFCDGVRLIDNRSIQF